MKAFAQKLSRYADRLPCCIAVRGSDGEESKLGDGDPVLSVDVKNPRGRRALLSLSQLEICEAYIRGDLDFEGDLIEAIGFRDLLGDRQWRIKLWRRIKPLIRGRSRCRAEWIAEHYDHDNVQLASADRSYHTYTPGIYHDECESLEVAAERKFENAFCSLRLQPGQHVLDVGCGWGGFVRYCASRGVRVTGITLSKDQLAFVKDLMARERLGGAILYQDFFTFDPPDSYDGISMMGVLEHLTDYRQVLRRLSTWVKPGGRVYLDFASSRERFGTSAFITKHAWPGMFRMVHLPELMAAMSEVPFEIQRLTNDRRNYYLYARDTYRRWMEQKAAVTERFGAELWRKFQLLHASVANVMSRPSYGVSAFQMVLQMPEAPDVARSL
jgi:cyclopropane-fatty-acyl-phospholipid synthase